jgi:outer membrane protein TolC
VSASSDSVGYFAARTLDAEEKLLQDTVTQYEQALQLNQDRYQGGLASEVDVRQARTILETTRAQLVDVGVARAQFEHAVAVLVGNPPADFTLSPLPLTTPPPPIPVGVPSQLLERRPDIAGAERRVAAANAQVGLAKTAYYPLINLFGSGGFESGAITTLLQGPARSGPLDPPLHLLSSMAAEDALAMIRPKQRTMLQSVPTGRLS